MATSIAHQNNGEFDFRFKDGKFNPFEGAGAISEWMLTVNGYEAKENENNEMTYGFNPNVIDDVIIYISYTARMGKEI
ncbi:MAG: hypothetical protein MJY99_05640 [Fibrobacter sp.]|nr:hypothetical protein [Fibrobacter sp.]